MQFKLYSHIDRNLWFLLLVTFAISALLIGVVLGCKTVNSPELSINSAFDDNLSNFEKKLTALRWVAYSPTNYNPNTGLYPEEKSILKDLQVLRQAGFEGIVTYGSARVMGNIPKLAKQVGFRGVIAGIWSLEESDGEIANAKKATKYVDGYVVGNEGLSERYSLKELELVVSSLCEVTQKPVTTTEEISDYFGSPELLDFGDWVFPNVHPYWAGKKNPQEAINWTVSQYQSLKGMIGDRTLVLKEVGLPTDGDSAASETNQAKYYRLLKDTHIQFIWFEAFDQPWKNWASVEPHWGLFRSDRSPKVTVEMQESDL